MKLTSPTTLAVWLASTLGAAQNCPLHGPAYPAPTDVASPAFVAAKAKWDEALASHPQVNKTAISFAVEFYSAGKDGGTIHRSFNTADHQKGKVDVGPDTLFRVHSISKVITVYAILSKLGYKHWHDPVTKWVPELVKDGNDPISDVDWDEVTLGSLASSMSGISRSCTTFPRRTISKPDC
jgi:CubicO group peptidase (beta-lactamase class C family)